MLLEGKIQQVNTFCQLRPFKLLMTDTTFWPTFPAVKGLMRLHYLLLKRREPGTPCAAAYLRTAAEARFTSCGVSWSKGWSVEAAGRGHGVCSQ